MSILVSPLVSRVAAVLTAALACLVSLFASAQDFPSKPITLVVAYPPGSATDMVARRSQS